MPLVRGTLQRPGGGAATDGSVVVELVGENGRRVRGFTGGGVEIVGVHRPAINASTAAWEVTLVANSLIVDPVGTMWKFTRRVDDVTHTDPGTVPNGAGPYDLEDIIEDGFPGGLPGSALAAHLADTVDAHDASAVSVLDTADHFAATQVEGALAELGKLAAYNLGRVAVGNGVADDTAAFTAAEASSAATVNVPAGTFLVNSSVTLTKTYRLMEGAVIKPASGVTVTFSPAGRVEAGLYQIFDLSLGGSVVGLMRTIAEWFGDVADGLAFEKITIALAGSTTLTINDGGVKLPPAADLVGKTIVVPAAGVVGAQTTTVAQVTLPLPLTARTLTLTSTVGFELPVGRTSMLAYVGGQLITYTGVSGNDLTGVLGGEGIIAAGTPISNISNNPSPNSAYDHSTRLVTTIAARLSDTTLQLAAAAGAAVTNGVADVVGTDNKLAWDRCLAATANGGTMLFGPGIHDAEKQSVPAGALLDVLQRRNITVDAFAGRARLRLRPNSLNSNETHVVELRNSVGIRLTDRIEVIGSNMTIASANEQMHAVHVRESRDCDIDCDTLRPYGDAVRFLGTATPGDVENHARDIRVTGKHRFPWRGSWQFQRGVSHVDIGGESVSDIMQSGGFIHCEPSAVNADAPYDIHFTGVKTRQLGRAKVGMQVQGISQTNPCRRWRFVGCQIDGSAKLQAGIEDFQFDGTVIEGNVDDIAFQLDREVSGVSFDGGAIRGRRADNPVVSTNYVAGQGGARNIRIDTRIEQLATGVGAAVSLEDTTNVTIQGDVVGIGQGVGVLVRNTQASYGAHRDIHIHANIKNFVTAERWTTHADTETFQGCSSQGTRFDDQAVPTMTTGFLVDPGGGVVNEWLKNHRLECTFGPEVTTPISLGSSVKSVVIGGNPPDRADYRIGAITPEGVVTATPGSTARGTDGRKWFKATGTGNTGWIPDGGPLQVSAQTGAYTLVLADAMKVVEVNSAGAVNITIPTNASVAFPINTVVEVYQQGAGQLTVVAAGGVTLRAPGGAKTRAQFSTVSLRKRGTDEWVLSGDAAT